MDFRIKSFEEYQKTYKKSVDDPADFWAEIAEHYQWEQKWDSVLDWDFRKPEVKWFLNAKTNITINCIDRHLENNANKTAIIWEPNDPNDEHLEISYKELSVRVNKFANVLKSHGIKKGDRVCIYMPMVLELGIAVLACARIGAIHSVVFAGFSSKSLSDRINDAECCMVLTSDGAYRGGKSIPLKSIVDEALESCDCVNTVLVLKRTGEEVTKKEGLDYWLQPELDSASSICPAEIMDAEDPLFILYTSGSTGKPKGIFHTCGGYMVYTGYSFKNVFQYEENDIYWCTADIGWITGHSYIIYGPLLNAATTIMFEGIPTWPTVSRFWEMVEKYKINQFYTAPTAIRALEKFGVKATQQNDLSSLKVLGTVGEPINEEAWHWYNDNIGKRESPIVDTWWQTETGGIMISPLPGITKLKPTYATLPLPGIQPTLMDEKGNEIIDKKAEGRLCIKFPWPSMARSVWGDHERYKNVYFSAFDNKYFTGDGCKRDEDGFYRITGRVDDVIIVSGHNLGTAEIESAIDEHELVCETAVVGFPHDVKGNAVYAFVTLFDSKKSENEVSLRTDINKLISDTIGPIAKADKIQFVPGLPKTRSGKIMRRILRKIAEGDTSNLGDTSTLLDPSVVEEIKEGAI